MLPRNRSRPSPCGAGSVGAPHDEERTPWERQPASFMSLYFGGQREIKACATRRVVFSPQATAMRFKDGTTDAKPHAGPVELGGKEGIKDLVRLLWGKSHAGIAERHQNLLVFRLRLDHEFPATFYIFHRLNAIDHEVHQHLLQLHTISHNPGKIFYQVCVDGDVISRCLAPQ